ncbi:MAG: hypothetical protein IE931_06650 [Sphingobacteriales bacterium]|nr:hypothetical protein [Sphingobacteriales bacterium]
MESPKLAELKKELNFQESHELKELCLRLAKYKTENKELLHYLLFYQDKKEAYVMQVKELIMNEFDDLHPSIYYVGKQLRKLTRIMNKHIKYISEKHLEVEIALAFCESFIQHPIVKSNYRAIDLILFRQLKRINKLLPKLQEDLQFDYQQDFDAVLKELKLKRPSFHIHEIS